MDSQPTRLFQDPREVLKTQLASIVAGTASRLKETSITYRVSGGPPSKQLLLELRVSGTGVATYQHSDELQGKKITRARRTLPEDDTRALFQQVYESGLLDQRDTGMGFLPDSVIGSISIESDGAVITYHFLANEYQQTSQRKEPSAPIQKLKPLLENLSEVVQKTPRTRTSTKKEAKKRR